MANSNTEKTIHAEITDLLQKIYDEHGIKVSGIDASWTDVSTMAEQKQKVNTVELITSSHAD